ncbi:MAG: hypothetical protein ACREDF_10740, partial [Thermoplasmata archaeon]
TVVRSLVTRLRENRRLLIVVVGVVIIGLILSLVTDIIRLGPSDVILSEDALSVTMEFIRIPDGDNVYDYYYLVVTVSNHVSDSTIQPYEAEVTLQANPTAESLVHYPWVEYHEEPVTLEFPDVDRIFTFPAGDIGYREPSSNIGHWSVRGESALRSRPIFENAASFLLKIRLDDGSNLRLSSVVTVTWYYHSPVQAYPIASRTITSPTLLSPSGRPST